MSVHIPHFRNHNKEQKRFEQDKKRHQELFEKRHKKFADILREAVKKQGIECYFERDNSFSWFKVDFFVNKEHLQVITTNNGMLALETYVDMDPGFPVVGVILPNGKLIRQWRKFEKFEREFLKVAEKFTKKEK